MLTRREFLAATTAAAALAAAPAGAVVQLHRGMGRRALKNYGPNYDYGGRVITAWLDR